MICRQEMNKKTFVTHLFSCLLWPPFTANIGDDANAVSLSCLGEFDALGTYRQGLISLTTN